jgi:hypothetical protein
VSNRRISFSQHINKSVKSSSHARRVTLADLTPGISTPQEHALWQHLYCMHTIGTRTQWNAFTAEWNGIADIHAQGGSKAIMHKRVDQLQKYQHKQVRDILSQTHAPAGPFTQAGQPPPPQQPQQQTTAGGGLDSTAAAAAAAAAGAAAAMAGSGYPGVSHYYPYQQPLHPSMLVPGAGQFVHSMFEPLMGAAPVNAVGLGGMYDAAAAAAAAGGTWGVGQGPYDPVAAAAKRSNWAASKGQRQAPPKQPRTHKPHRCNKCWHPLSGNSKAHKNGKEAWGQGLRCPGNCAACNQPMTGHTVPCPDPEAKQD